MVKAQSARLDRKKLFGDPVMVSTIVVLLIFLALFILYPLAALGCLAPLKMAVAPISKLVPLEGITRLMLS